MVDGPLPRVMPGGYPRGVAQKNRITIYQSTANQLAINCLNLNKYLPSNLEFIQCQSFNINYPRTRSFYNDFGVPQLSVLELPHGKKLVQYYSYEIRPSEIGVMFINLAQKKQLNHPIHGIHDQSFGQLRGATSQIFAEMPSEKLLESSDCHIVKGLKPERLVFVMGGNPIIDFHGD